MMKTIEQYKAQRAMALMRSYAVDGEPIYKKSHRNNIPKAYKDYVGWYAIKKKENNDRNKRKFRIYQR